MKIVKDSLPTIVPALLNIMLQDHTHIAMFEEQTRLVACPACLSLLSSYDFDHVASFIVPFVQQNFSHEKSSHQHAAMIAAATLFSFEDGSNGEDHQQQQQQSSSEFSLQKYSKILQFFTVQSNFDTLLQYATSSGSVISSLTMRQAALFLLATLVHFIYSKSALVKHTIANLKSSSNSSSSAVEVLVATLATIINENLETIVQIATSIQSADQVEQSQLETVQLKDAKMAVNYMYANLQESLYKFLNEVVQDKQQDKLQQLLVTSYPTISTILVDAALYTMSNNNSSLNNSSSSSSNGTATMCDKFFDSLTKLSMAECEIFMKNSSNSSSTTIATLSKHIQTLYENLNAKFANSNLNSNNSNQKQQQLLSSTIERHIAFATVALQKLIALLHTKIEATANQQEQQEQVLNSSQQLQQQQVFQLYATEIERGTDLIKFNALDSLASFTRLVGSEQFCNSTTQFLTTALTRILHVIKNNYFDACFESALAALVTVCSVCAAQMEQLNTSQQQAFSKQQQQLNSVTSINHLFNTLLAFFSSQLPLDCKSNVLKAIARLVKIFTVKSQTYLTQIMQVMQKLQAQVSTGGFEDDDDDEEIDDEDEDDNEEAQGEEEGSEDDEDNFLSDSTSSDTFTLNDYYAIWLKTLSTIFTSYKKRKLTDQVAPYIAEALMALKFIANRKQQEANFAKQRVFTRSLQLLGDMVQVFGTHAETKDTIQNLVTQKLVLQMLGKGAASESSKVRRVAEQVQVKIDQMLTTQASGSAEGAKQ